MLYYVCMQKNHLSKAFHEKSFNKKCKIPYYFSKIISINYIEINSYTHKYIIEDEKIIIFEHFYDHFSKFNVFKNPPHYMIIVVSSF